MKTMNDPMLNIFYQNALQSLYSGCVTPADREVLSNSPLPAGIIEPFAAEESDPLQIMKMTFSALTAWIDEAKKASYFSKHFVQLSKLIRNGITTMGRGLVTLHNRGEDLSLAPMSISDLISVANYHFRKSYLGVIQTVKHHPEISERLLLNQLSWSNLLLRLYKTRDRLNEKPAIAADNTVPETEPARLPEKPKALPKTDRPLPDPAAFFEPASFRAPHALSALDGSRQPRPAVKHRTAGAKETDQDPENMIRKPKNEIGSNTRQASEDKNKTFEKEELCNTNQDAEKEIIEAPEKSNGIEKAENGNMTGSDLPRLISRPKTYGFRNPFPSEFRKVPIRTDTG